jgi:hypothetical protein
MRQLGGTLELLSSNEGGTIVRAQMPIAAAPSVPEP